MGEIGKYKEEVKYLEAFTGTVNTKRGQKHVESKIGKINGEDFIVTKDGLGIWIKIRKRKQDLQFNIPISQMYNVKKLKEKVKKTGEIRTYIVYEMTKGLHWSATFGKKDANGERMFEAKPSCSNCENYRKKEKKSGNSKQSGSSRSI